MEALQVFNEELQSLLDSKPPVSKAKMGLITRAAMKGIKYYKHIVHSVEKFIIKCKPEYKVPGLYVIDSIVRQSRHQFGIERNVYAARFSRNLQATFGNLFSSCNLTDKPKIVRVLNLWQKNGVFTSQVIQPLLDMANPNTSLTCVAESNMSSASSPINQDNIKQLHTSKHSNYSTKSSGISQQNSSSKQSRLGESGLKFSKNLLDFDYDEDDDDDDGDETPTEAEPPLSSTLSRIEMEQRNRNSLSTAGQQSSQQQHYDNNQLQPNNLPNQVNSIQTEQDPVLERWNKLIKQQSIVNDIPNDNSSFTDSKTTRHRSRSRSPNQASTSRDRSGMTRDESKRDFYSTQTNSRHHTNSTVKREDQRREERNKKCLPEIRDKHLTVCSSTLWLGHVPKTVSEADISDAFGEFGSITSINLIPPRGCAYVCMDRRQDAKRALRKSKDLKLNGNHIKMAWAPGKGFKEYKKLKEFWDVEIGASYIPYSKVDESIDLAVLEEGGVIDEDSMSMEMRERRVRKSREEEGQPKGTEHPIDLPLPALTMLSQPPPYTMRPPNTTILPPTALGLNPSLGVIPFLQPTVGSAMSIAAPIVPQTMAHTGRVNQALPQHTYRADDNIRSPNTLDQQISITERQINMVELQLSLIQQAQGTSQNQHGIPHTSAIYQQNQPDPMIFDLQTPQMLHSSQLVDPLQVPLLGPPNTILNQDQ